MTERKPPGKDLRSWVEDQIREAQASGAFDKLPGTGKPLADLGGEHDPDWWVKKLMKREQIVDLPPALALRARVKQMLAKLAGLRDEDTVRRAVEALNVEIRKVNATVAEGPPTTLAPLDVDEIVRAWRRRR
jgi:hypothetical protein